MLHLLEITHLLCGIHAGHHVRKEIFRVPAAEYAVYSYVAQQDQFSVCKFECVYLNFYLFVLVVPCDLLLRP